MRLKGFGVLQVEPTDYCNLRCKMCRPHRDSWAEIHGVPKGFLSLNLWQKIVDDLARQRVEFDHVIFQWLGDPLLHPNMDKLVAIAQRGIANQVQYFRIDSNMILLDEKRMRHMVEACNGRTPLLLVASIDAHSPEAYERVKGKDALSVVRKNLRRLLRIRNQIGADCPINLQLQFVVQEGNAHETNDFLQYWTDLLQCQGGEFWHDEIMFKRLSVDGGGAGQAEADRLYVQSVQQQGIRSGEYNGLQVCVWENRPWQRDDEHQEERNPCPALWATPVIRHDGRLMMCCADLQGDMSLGSLQEHSFLDLWNGTEAQRLRTEHLQGAFEGACKHCGGINWYSLPERAGPVVQI